MSQHTFSCILREYIIRIRNRVRLEVESRNRSTRLRDGLKAHLGFPCHGKVLMDVLNRAMDTIDEQGKGGGGASRKRRRDITMGVDSSDTEGRFGLSPGSYLTALEEGCGNDCGDAASSAPEEEMTAEWFYYKDFAFYNLTVESRYPWMRNPTVFSVLATVSFYLLTPILWCYVLKDDGICPADPENGGRRWLSSFYFASATMSTVGYDDVTGVLRRHCVFFRPTI